MTEEEKRQQEAFDFLASKFPARYRVKTTTYLQGLLKALAEGDAYIESQVEAVRDNSTTVTASGKYLDRLASTYGVVREQSAGILDDDFRQLVPVMGMSPKQITHTLQQIIDLIYGPYASHANTTSSSPAPFSIAQNARLKMLVDGETVEIGFIETDALDLNAMTAEEMANAITNKSNGRVIASVVENVRTSESFINIRTATIGSQGFIQILGGDAQRALRFPEIRPTHYDIGIWSIERYLGTDEMVMTVLDGASPALRSAGVQRGDYVAIRVDSGFAQENCGTFQITAVEENSFRIRNGQGSPEASITQAHIDDFVFFRPDMGNILLTARPATVLQTGSKELTVLLPVTSPIVKRTLKGGHHFHGGISNVLSVTTDTMTVGSVTGFSPSGSVRLQTSRKTNEGTVASITGSSITLISADGWPSYGSVYAPNTQTFYYFSGRNGNILTGVQPAPPNDIVGVPIRYDERFSYTGITGTTLTGVYPNPAAVLGFEVTSQITLEGDFIGAFLYDKAAEFVPSGVATRVSETIEQGSSKTVLFLDDISGFPEKGNFVLQYSTREQEGPIRYFGKVGDNALIIDPGHVFDRDHFKGSNVRMVRSLGGYTPRQNGDDYAVYLTGTGNARSLLAKYLTSVIAAGVVLKFQIQVPDYKWVVLPLLYANDPHDTSLAAF